MTLKDLSTAVHNKRYAGSSVPAHARPFRTFKEGSANELTKSILAYFELKGIKAWRQASEGRFIRGKEYTDWRGHKKEEKGQYIPRSKAAKGIGDVCAIVTGGRLLSVEVKYGKDKQSPEQKKFQQEIEASGGLYVIAYSWAGFIAHIERILK